MIRVVLADDHKMVRQGLRQILSELDDIRVAAEAASGEEFLALARKTDFDIAVLDISMPGINGLEALRQIKAEKKNVRVLILSMYPEDQYSIRALKSGADGYLTKDSAAEELVCAIRTVAAGKKYLTPSIAERLAYNLDENSEIPPHELLSDREFEVFKLIADGKTPTEIAETLFLSVKTISTYRARILEKMRMKTNAQLIHYAANNRIR